MSIEKEKLVAEALDTPEGRKMFADAIGKGVRHFIDTVFSKWDRPHQIRFVKFISG